MVTRRMLGFEGAPQEAARKRHARSQQLRDTKTTPLLFDSFERTPTLASQPPLVQLMIAPRETACFIARSKKRLE
jgi:hypothetical protein